MNDRTLIKIGFKIFRTGMEAKFRPFVDALWDTKTLLGREGPRHRQKPFNYFKPTHRSLLVVNEGNEIELS